LLSEGRGGGYRHPPTLSGRHREEKERIREGGRGDGLNMSGEEGSTNFSRKRLAWGTKDYRTSWSSGKEIKAEDLGWTNCKEIWIPPTPPTIGRKPAEEQDGFHPPPCHREGAGITLDSEGLGRHRGGTIPDRPDLGVSPLPSRPSHCRRDLGGREP